MNSNTEGNRDFAQEERGGQNPRYKTSQRRGWRYRGGSDRGSYNRAPRDRRYNQNSRDYSRQPQVPQSIDINDSSQWPSIQELSSGSISKSRTAPPPASIPEPQPNYHNEALDTQNDIAPTSRNGGPYVPPAISSVQGYPSAYSSQYPSRQNSTYRGRGARYAGSNRGFPSGYGRRFSRMPYQNFPGSVPSEQMFSGYINGHFVINPYVMPYMDDRSKFQESLRQVEYYFSPENLENDYYLKDIMDEDGYVDLNVIYNFKRIQRLDMGFDDFVKSLLGSEHLDIDVQAKKIRTSSEPKKWILDRKAVPESSASRNFSKKYGGSGYVYSAPRPTHVEQMIYPVNPVYTVPTARPRFYQPTIGVYPSPLYTTPYVDYVPEWYYEYDNSRYMQSYPNYPVPQNTYQGEMAEDATSEIDVPTNTSIQLTEPNKISDQDPNSKNIILPENSKELEEISSKMTDLEISKAPSVSSS